MEICSKESERFCAYCGRLFPPGDILLKEGPNHFCNTKHSIKFKAMKRVTHGKASKAVH